MSKTSDPPAHLSEFYSILSPSANIDKSNPQPPRPQVATDNATAESKPYNNGHRRNNSLIGAMGQMLRKASFSSLNTVGQSTIGSNVYDRVAENHPDLPAIITGREVNNTLNAYNQLLRAAESYRGALDGVSTAAAEFGAALQACAECKGAGSSADGLAAAGGLHFLVSNHQKVLANSIESTFENPVTSEVGDFKQEYEQRDEEFRKKLKEKSAALRKKEALNSKLARARTRNLQEYRTSLLELTTQIDDIDRLKYEYFQNCYELAQSASEGILQHAASVVRAQVEIYEGIARKGWSGGGLDELISTCPDPFESSKMSKNSNAPVILNSTSDRGLREINTGGNRSYKWNMSHEQDEQEPESESDDIDDYDDNHGDQHSKQDDNSHLKSSSNLSNDAQSSASPCSDSDGRAEGEDEDEDEEDDNGNETHDTLSIMADFQRLQTSSPARLTDRSDDLHNGWGESS